MGQNKYILKIETTGLDCRKDSLIQVLLIDLDGNIIYCKTLFCSNNNGYYYNNLSENTLNNIPMLPMKFVERELNTFLSGNILYSFNKEFDSSFIKAEPEEWIDILSLLPRRKRIPNLEYFRDIPSPIYRKALNILEFMKSHNIIDSNETEIDLSF